MNEQIVKFCMKIFNIENKNDIIPDRDADNDTYCSYSYTRETISITVRSQDDVHDIYTLNRYTYSTSFLLDLVECFDRCSK